jgi:Type II CAAX prenyl endopeptidase Rce1-like
VIIFVSTLVFAAIHLLTNSANFYQILSWLISGAILAYAYLISGSIWVPIVIHFATDLTNVFVFNNIGQLSFFTITPAPTDRHRALVRAAYAILLLAALLAFYGPALKMVSAVPIQSSKIAFDRNKY